MESIYDEIDVSILSSRLDEILEDTIKRRDKLFHNGTKFYIAGPWFTSKSKLLLNGFVKRTTLETMTKTSFEYYYPNEEYNKTPKDAYQNNVKHLEKCDAVIALIDEKDVGTAWEIGYALALRKPVYLLGLDETSFKKKTNVMLSFGAKCITCKDLYYLLTNQIEKVKFIKIDNIWEGKE